MPRVLSNNHKKIFPTKTIRNFHLPRREYEKFCCTLNPLPVFSWRPTYKCGTKYRISVRHAERKTMRWNRRANPIRNRYWPIRIFFEIKLQNYIREERKSESSRIELHGAPTTCTAARRGRLFFNLFFASRGTVTDHPWPRARAIRCKSDPWDDFLLKPGHFMHRRDYMRDIWPQ